MPVHKNLITPRNSSPDQVSSVVTNAHQLIPRTAHD